MKRCSRCRFEKSPEDFPRDKHKKDGLGTYCKPCCADRKASPGSASSAFIRLAITTRDDAGAFATNLILDGRSVVTDSDSVTILDRLKRPLFKFKPSQLVAMSKLCGRCTRPPFCPKCAAIIREQEEKTNPTPKKPGPKPVT